MAPLVEELVKICLLHCSIYGKVKQLREYLAAKANSAIWRQGSSSVGGLGEEGTHTEGGGRNGGAYDSVGDGYDSYTVEGFNSGTSMPQHANIANTDPRVTTPVRANGALSTLYPPYPPYSPYTTYTPTPLPTVTVRSFVIHMLSISLGLKLADSTRRILLYSGTSIHTCYNSLYMYIHTHTHTHTHTYTIHYTLYTYIYTYIYEYI